MDKIAQLVTSYKDEMKEHRRLFHSHPESGWATFWTTAKIASFLKSYGYELKFGDEVVCKDEMYGVANEDVLQAAYDKALKLLTKEEAEILPKLKGGKTGLVATIDTKRPGKCVAFRFDIDGVDVTESKEKTHRPTSDGFSSQNDGVTHACGHDGHITIGLALAKAIASNLDKFNGKFKFIFQTGEEGCRGAVGMEAAGILKGIDYLFGAHIGFKATEDRSFICRVNKILSTTKFDVYLKGLSAHASAEPQKGANALLAAAQMALLMHGITRHGEGVTRVNVGVLRAGEGRNVIAPNGYLACETRGETTELNEFMYDKCVDIIEGVSKAFGVEYKIVRTGGTGGGDSSKEAGEFFYEAALESPFIDNDKIIKEYDFGACEDFSHFMDKVQKNGGISGYAMIGTKLKAGHHNCLFDFNEDALCSGLDVFLRIATKINGNNK